MIIFTYCGRVSPVRARHPFTIEAAVILPEDAIWTLPEQDTDFALRWHLIKKRLLTRSNARRADLRQLCQ
jgi:putative transposase